VKKLSHDEHYAVDPWRRFLWSREKLALTNFIKEFFKEIDIYLLGFACGAGRIVGFLEDHVTEAVGVESVPQRCIVFQFTKLMTRVNHKFPFQLNQAYTGLSFRS